MQNVAFNKKKQQNLTHQNPKEDMISALTVPIWGLILQWLSDSEQHFSL